MITRLNYDNDYNMLYYDDDDWEHIQIMIKIITCFYYNDDDDLNIMRTHTNYDNDYNMLEL